MADEESTGTVVVALVANLAIAVAKIAAGLIGGSSAMLAEGAHSVADTTNQVFLLASLRLSRKAPDDTHPFGYGKERFFWSLLAAIGIFVSGAVFSIYQGVHELLSGESEVAGYLLSYAVLFISFLAEGTSWLKAVRQLRTEARAAGRGMIEHVRLSSDPTVKTVFSEDTAALIGLLLAVVAYLLGRDTKEMLIGEAAPAPVRDGIRSELADHPEVDRVLDVRTMLLGPEALLVAARLDMDDSLGAADVEDSTDAISAGLRTKFPQVREVYLDVTSGGDRQVAATSPEASSTSSTSPRPIR